MIPACLPDPGANLTGVRGTIVGWGFTSTKRQAFKILEEVQDRNGVSQVPETHQQKAEITVLDSEGCGHVSRPAGGTPGGRY